MNKKGKIVLLLLLSLLLTSALTLNFTGTISQRLSTGKGQYDDPITIDFLTIQSLMKAVSIKEIPVKNYIQTIDSLNQTWDFKKIRNPFSKKPKAKQRPIKKRKYSSKKKTRKRRPSITVNGIIWDESKPYAILNGEIYGVGDQLKGFTVQAISDSLVILSNSTDIYTVKYTRD